MDRTNLDMPVDLGRWLKEMDKLNKEEEYLATSFENVCDYFINRINEILSGRKNSFSPYDKDLLKDFCKYLQNENKAIKKCKPQAVKNVINYNPQFDLRDARKKGRLGNTILELKKFKKQLTIIKNIHVSKCMLDQVSKSIILSPNDRSYQRYFIEFLRSKYQTQSVIKPLKRLVAQIFFDLYKSKVYQRITNDKYILKNSERIYISLSNDLHSSFKELLNQEKFNELFTKIFQSNSNWKYNQNIIVQNSKKCLKYYANPHLGNIEELKDLKFGSNQINEIKKNIRDFIYRILSNFIFNISTNLFNDLFSRTISNLVKDEYFKYLSQIIQDTLEQKGNDSIFSFIIGRCQVSHFSHHMAEKLCDLIYDGIIENEVLQFSLLLMGLPRKIPEINSNDPNKKIANSLEYKLLVTEYLNRLTKSVLKWFANNFEISKIAKYDQLKFVRGLVQVIFRSIRSGEEMEQRSTILTLKVWSRVISLLKKKITMAKEKPWKVIFLIGNLDCRNEIIDVGDVKFYDPRKWDFGENDFIDTSGFRISSNEEFTSRFESFHLDHSKDAISRNSARAVIFVKAIEESRALDIAREKLIRSINFLVFEFSDKFYGFKPQLPLYYHITDIRSNMTPLGFHRDQLYGIYEIDEESQNDLKIVHKFLTNSNRTDYILPSLEWYHQGFWNLSEHGRFVYYWIALERLITQFNRIKSKSMEKALLYYLPKVVITWRSSSIWYAVSNHLHSIILGIQKNGLLKSKLKNHTELREWNNGYAILENLEYLKKVAHDPAIVNQISLMKEFLTRESMKKVKKEVSNRRKMEKFKIAYIYSVRNSLFHEGKIYSERKLAECNINLKKILDTMIQSWIVQTHLTFNSLINNLNRPYYF